MDLVSLAEWSRYVVGLALFGYLASWLAFNSEMGIRTRIQRERTALEVQEAEPALVGDAEPDRAGVSTTGDGDDSRQLLGDLGERAESRHRLGNAAFIVATAILAVGVVMRGVGVSRTPWSNMHEFSITAALVMSIVYIAVSRTNSARATARVVGPWVAVIAFVTLGLAVTFVYVPPGPLVPSLQSYWLVIHVGLAVTAFGLFAVAAVTNTLQIIAERAERRGSTGKGGFVSSLPRSSLLDRLAYRLTAVAFPIWTAGPLILGAVWAEVSWGRYWNWDPKEVWALITWLVYAAYLHAHATAGWKGSKASVVALIGFATALFSYFGVNIFFTSEHSYGGL
ncbi:c-type cytochrome biogenesis protein CcsB [Actinobacteria bacterium YIM 96077]|uniref:C-type cytochrome biogenesis protein CcsB n=1 Tax=Phytoactinopolyspora halophila TaxID=1981511 RepID=A0A329QLP7_9ACTN|nr:c-type cytochrome biogenesis protein CcsB [Phytoactinopolyspora halophila]AYY14802.1 c-type cytochrome biogenesis protein CcsB [Actinobacteria bacterium YIM 96077]RAW13076.1 c-type cytochrome biogenesis protein CcsB [Phytoactinopolyspora halophila]